MRLCGSITSVCSPCRQYHEDVSNLVLCLIFVLNSSITAHMRLIYLTWLSFLGEGPAVNTTWSTRLAQGSLLLLGCLESTSLSRRWSLCIRRYKLQFGRVYYVTWLTRALTVEYKTCHGRQLTEPADVLPEALRNDFVWDSVKIPTY